MHCGLDLVLEVPSNGTASLLLWEVLEAAYSRLGFDAVGDEAFKSLVLGRVIEPTCKADTLRVLADVGVPAPSLRTVFRSLARCVGADRPGCDSRFSSSQARTSDTANFR